MPHEFVRPFHFWCQKVLPLVFDDSLSYYEVLAKMRDYLNNAIAEINEIGGEFEGVKNQLTQLKAYIDEYFEKLDVSQAISDKLDDMVESGEMDAIITPIFAAYANPLFAGSVADMIATNFAYANYENNKIYTFNQSTGLYQTTGKEFGGVVSSVDEMENNDKYYALDSDGMLYSYDFPEGAFVETGLTYGGYRYGVNAMRPISNVYVLTSNSHVYTWNGSEYVDTGIVYSLSNTAFVWRRQLTSEDNIASLEMDGWYYFTANNPPQGLPFNMEPSDGFSIIYTVPESANNSENINTENGQTAQTQRAQTIKIDSRNKRIILETTSGGVWFWDGLTWIEQSENGFSPCLDCNSITWNSVTTCDANTTNKPCDTNGILKTFSVNNERAQIFFSKSECWFRTNENWHRIVKGEEQQQNEKEFDTIYAFITASINATNKRISGISQNVDSLIAEKEILYSVITTVVQQELVTQNEKTLTCENNSTLRAQVIVGKTDATLTKSNVAADAKATGDAINKAFVDIMNVDNELQNTAATVEAITKELNYLKPVIGEGYFELATNSGNTLATELNATIKGVCVSVKTDTTLSNEGVPADAKATGNAIAVVENELLELNANVETLESEFGYTKSILDYGSFDIATNNGQNVTTETSELINGVTISVKTDDSLSNSGIPADAKATGDAINIINARVNNIQNALETTEASVKTITKELNYLKPVIGEGYFELATNSGNTLATENGRPVNAVFSSVKTDKTLSICGIPADAKATGEAINKLNIELRKTKANETENATFITENYFYIRTESNTIISGTIEKTSESDKPTRDGYLLINNKTLTSENGERVYLTTINPYSKTIPSLVGSAVCFVGDSITAGAHGTGYNPNGPVIATINGRTWRRNVTGKCATNTIVNWLKKYYYANGLNNGMGGADMGIFSTSTAFSSLMPPGYNVIALSGSVNDCLKPFDYYAEQYYESLALIQKYCRDNNKLLIYIMAIPAGAKYTSATFRITKWYALSSKLAELCDSLNIPCINLYNDCYRYYWQSKLPIGNWYEAIELHPTQEMQDVLQFLLAFNLGLCLPVEVNPYG